MAKLRFEAAEDSGVRIDRYLSDVSDLSRSRVQALVKDGLITVNGKPVKSSYAVCAGDIIEADVPEDQPMDLQPENIPLDIIFEDDDLILVNKQPGIIVHPTKGHPEHTIANAVMYYMQQTDQVFKVRFANRIDMDTTGIIIVAKNANAQNDLSNQMRHNSVIKKYIALVEGCVEEDHFTIDLPIGRPDQISIQRKVMEEGGKNAVTEVRVIDRFDSEKYGPHTLLEILLHTGRTHQIRVHLSHVGHVIAGDILYGGRTDIISRQALHAYHIEFTHPATGEYMTFETDLPEDIRSAIDRLK